VQDITERRRMEQELKRHSEHLEELVEEKTKELVSSRQFLEASMESAPDFVYIKNKDFKYVFVNESFCKFHGKSKDQILGGTIYDVYPKEQADFFTQQDREVFETGSINHSPDLSITDVNGSTHRVYVIKAPIKDAKGNVTYLVGVTRDITELKRAEETLRESEERYRLLVEHAPETILIHSEGKFVYVNPAGAKLLGAANLEQLIGKPVMDMIHPDHQEIVKERTRKVHEEEAEAPLIEMKYTRLDGSEVDVEAVSTHFIYQGRPAVQVVAHDITERKKIDQIKDRFVSAVTHELRTPLTSISGYTDLALSDKSRPLNKEVRNDLEVIKRNTDRLISITDDLLDIRRIESGKLKLNISSLNLKEIIDHCSIEIKPFLKEKQELHIQVPDVLPPIQGDQVRLSQVLLNLLSNAAKFTPEGGNIKLSVKDEEGMVKIQVSDTGIGIRNEDLKHVFEPFADIQKPTYIKGTGLGLSVAKGLVNAHGGQIYATSDGEGKGATFTFTLPKHGAKEVSQP
jgi:PAS domain S-box-containing protein